MSIEQIQRKFTRLINDIGTLSYGARLKSFDLKTLAERRMRRDLIEKCKIVRGFVNYGQSMFQISRNGMNLVSRGKKVSKSRKDFLSERVINYWKSLPPPPYVKVSTSVEMGDRFLVNTNCFWEVPELVPNRIETQAALAGRSALCDYSSDIYIYKSLIMPYKRKAYTYLQIFKIYRRENCPLELDTFLSMGTDP